MSKFLTGLWMMKKMMMIHDPIGDYSLSPKRAPDSSWHLPRGLTEEPRPCQCRAQEEVRDAEGSPLMNSGGRAKLDCEDDAWDRRGVNPDGHPGSPLPAPLQDRLRRPAAREYQEVRQMLPLHFESGNYYINTGAVPVSAKKMSPLQRMEDKTKGCYMDVRKPSSMQTRWRSVA